MTVSETTSFLAKARKPSPEEKLLGLILRSLPIRHGKHRLLSELDRRWRIGSRGWVAVPYGKSSVVVDSGDLVGRHFLMLRHFDPEVCEVLVASAGERQEVTVWDIGANQGAFCYGLLSRMPKARIVAIEPQAQLHELLQQNLAAIAPSRFETVCAGIGAKEEKMALTIPEGNMGQGTLREEAFAHVSSVESVSVVPPQTVFEGSAFGPPDLIKIDVEGYEPVVIQALADFLKQWRTRAIVFESHHEGDVAFQQIVRTLEGLDYQVRRITKTMVRTELCTLNHRQRPASDFVALRSDIIGTKSLAPLIRD